MTLERSGIARDETSGNAVGLAALIRSFHGAIERAEQLRPVNGRFNRWFPRLLVLFARSRFPRTWLRVDPCGRPRARNAGQWCCSLAESSNAFPRNRYLNFNYLLTWRRAVSGAVDGSLRERNVSRNEGKCRRIGRPQEGVDAIAKQLLS
jgi:hypothetical protein